MTDQGTIMAWPGEAEAWDALTQLCPDETRVNAKVLFNPHNSTYVLNCFGQDIFVSLNDRDIYSNSALGQVLVNQYAEYSHLSILKYLIHSRDLPCSGQMIPPFDLPGGDIFVKGTHILPLDDIAGCFDGNVDKFVKTGKNLAGTQLEYGDMSFKLFPFPRVPVVIIVWEGDEEFPAKATLLLDAGCVSQIPTEIVWSTAMMSVKMLLQSARGK
ncbi:DUF3786 domain-containing protein [Desulfurivibrio alkaliphilus]|nr:DUF3786 domain-containing protein [Desulfurivibrio alkaliphilus]